MHPGLGLRLTRSRAANDIVAVLSTFLRSGGADFRAMRLWHQAPRGLHMAAEAQAVAAVYSRVKEELKGKKGGQ